MCSGAAEVPADVVAAASTQIYCHLYAPTAMSSGLMGQRWVSLYERLDEEEKEREEKAKSEKRRLSMAHATATTVPRRLCMRQQHVVNRGWEAPLVPYHIWTSKFANAMLIVSVLGPWDPLLVVLAWILIASM